VQSSSDTTEEGRLGRLLSGRWTAPLLGTAALVLFLLVVVVITTNFASPADRNIVLAFLINLTVVIGLQTFAGNAGIVSFGHVGLMAVGAYTAALVTTDAAIKQFSIPRAPDFLQTLSIGWVPGALIAIVITAAFAFVVGIPIVRLSGAAAAVATLGLLVIVFVGLSNYDQLTRGAKAFYGAPEYTTLYRALICAALALLAARLFRESRTGLSLRSSRQDALAARASGVRVERARLAAWTLSAGLVGLGGALYAGFIPSLTPKDFYFDLTFIIVTMVIVGGSSTSAAVVGASIVSVLTELLRRLEGGFSVGSLHIGDAPGLSTLGVGLLIIATMMLRPSGLLGRWEVDELVVRARRALARRREARTG
jgi:branched-chain amino acid transport system permease protein